MVQILDATLREGEQTPGVYFDNHIKLAIAELLDQVGVDIIEAGHPLVSSSIRQAVREIAHSKTKATIGAHARSLQKDVDEALNCGVSFLGIFYCVSEQRLKTVFKKSLTDAIEQITTTIRYAREQNPKLQIRYTPEDTVRSPFENVVSTAVAAVRAGANIISIADTTGYMVPGTQRNMHTYVKNLRTALSEHDVHPKIAVHCHNDRGFALTNVLDAYRAGADIIDTTVLGIGERAGIVDLAQLLVSLKNDFHEKNRWNLKKLPELYELVSHHSGVPVPVNFPVTGRNAFTHCAGVHTHAASINPMHYESLSPSIVGRERAFSLDHMSGLASVRYALSLIGMSDLDQETTARVLTKVKEVGERGKTISLDELRHIVEWVKKHRVEASHGNAR